MISYDSKTNNLSFTVSHFTLTSYFKYRFRIFRIFLSIMKFWATWLEISGDMHDYKFQATWLWFRARWLSGDLTVNHQISNQIHYTLNWHSHNIHPTTHTSLGRRLWFCFLKTDVHISLNKSKMQAWWILWTPSSTLHYSCNSTKSFFIEDSWFQNTQGLIV